MTQPIVRIQLRESAIPSTSGAMASAVRAVGQLHCEARRAYDEPADWLLYEGEIRGVAEMRRSESRRRAWATCLQRLLPRNRRNRTQGCRTGDPNKGCARADRLTNSRSLQRERLGGQLLMDQRNLEVPSCFVTYCPTAPRCERRRDAAKWGSRCQSS